jgi:pyrroloquinoline quinone biosynthesis protein B
MKHFMVNSFVLLAAVFTGCSFEQEAKMVAEPSASTVRLVVLGTVQDAGSPHIACRKDCCRALFDAPDPSRQVTALGLIDDETGKQFLFEASPDISRQTKKLRDMAGRDQELPDGIFLTHAHIGHYTGLMYFGREATNAPGVPVYAMPRMDSFLRTNGPWNQLVTLGNIVLNPLQADSSIELTPQVTITPFTVPHRDEFSETVGYRIEGPGKSALFIPDIDKWERWGLNIEEAISDVDYAFLDGTFFDGAELNTRDISQIPHPFVSESLARFKALPVAERTKIHFIHFNHTNQLLNQDTEEFLAVKKAGMHVAIYGQEVSLD